jgi:hypothetical protein
MVWLGGPRRTWGTGRRGIYLHDPPPGYRPPEMPSKDRQRLARQDWLLMRIATVVLILVAVAFVMIMSLIIATHS